ncbi:MAG: hypothetical protein CME98_02940 [Hyphomonas sp.]|nr:hypothetical protein [Hyphomonas sp.]
MNLISTNIFILVEMIFQLLLMLYKSITMEIILLVLKIFMSNHISMVLVLVVVQKMMKSTRCNYLTAL